MRKFFQKFHIKFIEYFVYNWNDMVQSPSWFVMRKTARFHWLRNWYQRWFTKQPNLDYLLAQKSRIFPDINVEDVVNNLEKFGLYQGIQLPKLMTDEIVEFALNNNCYGKKNPKYGFRVHEKETAELYYENKFLIAKFFNTAAQCPAIKMLQQDPVLLAIAAKYLKAHPVHISNSLWWSFPVATSNTFEQSKAAQVYHLDLDDFQFIKFFFYLTDVDLGGGPHVYIRGSHKQKKFLDQLLRGRATEEDLMKYYGHENAVTICGSAGWGFAEDTFGYHKGSTPTDKPRLMLQIEFATRDYGTQHDYMNPDKLRALSASDKCPVNLNIS